MGDPLYLGVYTAINLQNTVYPCYRQTGFLREMSELAQAEKIKIIVFDEHGVNWVKRECKGICWVMGQWQRTTVPLPKVIYDRYQNFRLTSKSHAVRQKLFRTKGVRVFNSISTDKWLVYNLLKQAGVSTYLPQTALVKSYKEIEHFLAQYDNIWLKPCKGSQGRGIYCVTKLKKDVWRVWSIDSHDQINTSVYYSDRQLVKGLFAEVQKCQRSYIIQQGILTKCINGNPFDIRVLVQRDGKNQWRITGQGIRVSENGNKVTNLFQGGRAETITLLQNYSSGLTAYMNLKNKIERLALTAAEAIANQEGYVAELGIDILIGRTNKPYFVEANTRPGRKIFRLTGELETRKLAHQRVLSYARYLLTHG